MDDAAGEVNINVDTGAHYRGRRVLITGGAGFIGSHLVEALVGLGAHVRVIDDFSNGKRENLSNVLDQIELFEHSILDDAALRRAVSECSIVFHQAALGSVPQSVKEPLRYHEINSTGTLRTLEAARHAGAARVVYASSSSVYGESEELPKRESMPPAPCSPYAASKLAGEHWCSAYAHCYDLSTVSLRYFNVFGPRQRPDSDYAAVVPAFAAALRNGRGPVIYGDGEQSRDFTHVANVVHANLLAGASGRDLRGEPVNIACGERYTLLQLLDAMQRALGTALRPRFEPSRPGDVRHSQADVSAARELFGYQTVVGFEAGLASV